jgi:predicted transcriptional regulator
MDEIILLTADKNYFLKTMKKFKAVEDEQKKLVQEAHEQLEQSMTNFADTMNAEIHDFEEIRGSADVPCVLKEL